MTARSNEISLKEVFDRYYDRLLYFAWLYVHDKETARDLVQDAFITYWDNINQVSNLEKQIKNYLYVSVKNACLKHIRHNAVVSKYQLTLEAEPQEEAIGLHRIIRAEVIGEIYRAIENLPEPYRKISKLGYIDGLKNQEIADLLNMPLNTVKSHKQKALRLLRLKLRPDQYVLFLVFVRLFS
ncbi:MAG: RNA polymerase sigma-70 factor [Bacteroidota bacterium]